MTAAKTNKENQFSGKVAIVTGASLGIGRATAIALGREGANVVVNYHSHAAAAEEVVKAVEQFGSRGISHQADVADQHAVEELVAHAQQEFGRVDLAIGNAVYSDREPFVEAEMDGFRRTVDVTMWGAFHLLRATSRRMIENGGGGAIVLVSSPHAFVPIASAMAYNMSKAAIEQMSKTAALELAEHGIRVNTIQPGWIDTPGERKFVTDEVLDSEAMKIPVGRLGTPAEIAEAILFLCNPVHEYMTGSTLLFDGGITLPWWKK